MFRRTSSFSLVRASDDRLENVPTTSCRGDVGTWGRIYRCREDATHGRIMLENIMGIGLPIPFNFVPSSPRLPGDTGGPLGVNVRQRNRVKPEHCAYPGTFSLL